MTDIPQNTLTGEDPVLISVEAGGICGSDLHYRAGWNPWALHVLGKHIENPPNLVMGYARVWGQMDFYPGKGKIDYIDAQDGIPFRQVDNP